MAKKKTHPADLVMLVLEETNSTDMARTVAHALKLPEAHCSGCNTEVPMDERDTSCLLCGRQVSDPVGDLKDQCTITKVGKGDIREIWSRTMGVLKGNENFVILMKGDAIRLFGDQIEYFASFTEMVMYVVNGDTGIKRLNMDRNHIKSGM